MSATLVHEQGVPALGPAVPTPAGQFLLFELGGHPFAVPLDTVDEIVRPSALSPLPRAPDAIEGLMSLRGRVIPVVDLRRCCALAPPDDHGSARTLVADAAGTVGFLVDRVIGVQVGDARHLDSDTGAHPMAGIGLVSAVMHAERGLVGVLDLARIVDREVAAALDRTPVEPARTVRRTERVESRSVIERDALALVSFDAGGQEFALPLAFVHEIVRAPAAPTPVPGSGAGVIGVTDLRRHVLPLLSLHVLLGLDSAGPGRFAVVIAPDAARASATVGLVVDGLRGVLAADREQVRPLPAGLSERNPVSKLCVLEDGRRLVSVLDVDVLFDSVRAAVDALPDIATDTTTGDGPMDDANDDLELIAFWLDGEEYLVDVTAVLEIVRHPGATVRVPDAPAHVAGLCNVRGEVLPLVDLRARVGAEPAEPGDATRVIVTNGGSDRVGLIVDAVKDLRHVPRAAIQPASDLAAASVAFVTGVVVDPSGDGLALVVDPSLVLGRDSTPPSGQPSA